MDLDTSAPGPSGADAPSLGALYTSHAASLAATLSGAESSPPSAVPPPAPPQETSPAPVPPATPVSAAPVTPQVDIEALKATLPPDALRYLEYKGGDLAKALATALRDDQRLAAIAKGEPDPLGQIKPVQAPEPPAPVEVEPQAIEAQVEQFFTTDPTCVRLASQFDQINAQLATNAQAITETATALQQAEWYAKLPEVAGDAYKAAEAAEAVRRYRSDLLSHRQEQSLLKSDKRTLKGDWDNRINGERGKIERSLAQQRQAQAQEAQAEARRAAAEEALVGAWTPSLTSAMTKHGIDASLQADFDRYCKNDALANIEQGILVTDVPGYMEQKAKEYSDMLDRHHRLVSARYAQAAAQRTQAGTAPGPVAVAPNLETDNKPKSLAELYSRTQQNVANQFAR